MITVKIGQYVATLDKGTWTCPDNPHLASRLQKVTDVNSVPTGTGNPDLLIAKKIMDAVGGTITHVTPRYGPRQPGSMLGPRAAID